MRLKMSDAPPAPPFVTHHSLGARLGSLFGTTLIGALVLFMGAVGALVLFNGAVGMGLFFVAMTAVMFVLFRYVWRDTGAKLGWHIVVDDDGVELRLPRARSLIHRLKPVRERVRFSEIAAVDGRLEGYASLGMAVIQRCYALRLENGRRIVLGEDRAQATAFASSLLTAAVKQIVRRGQVAVNDLGMVEGRGGIVGVLFASAPPWDAPTLSAERQAWFWRKARMTGAVAEGAAFVPLFGSGGVGSVTGGIVTSSKMAQAMRQQPGESDFE
jgi:hypothetical protein